MKTVVAKFGGTSVKNETPEKDEKTEKKAAEKPAKAEAPEKSEKAESKPAEKTEAKAAVKPAAAPAAVPAPAPGGEAPKKKKTIIMVGKNIPQKSAPANNQRPMQGQRPMQQGQGMPGKRPVNPSAGVGRPLIKPTTPPSAAPEIHFVPENQQGKANEAKKQNAEKSNAQAQVPATSQVPAVKEQSAAVTPDTEKKTAPVNANTAPVKPQAPVRSTDAHSAKLVQNGDRRNVRPDDRNASRPQGGYRRIVWGSRETALFSYDPAVSDKVETLSSWGFPGVYACWNWPGQEGRKVDLAVFSQAEEVELIINGTSQGRVRAGETLIHDMPLTFLFHAVYEQGTVKAVSYAGGQEVSRTMLVTTDSPRSIRLQAETDQLKADGHSLCYVNVQILDREGRLVPDAQIPLTADISGQAMLLGFGSGNPITSENYTSGRFTSDRGQAVAVLRAGYEPG